MSDTDEKQPDAAQLFMQMAEMWRAAADKNEEIGELWSGSMMPFLSSRVADGSMFPTAQGGEISEAIKRMVEGPRFADVWSLDRQFYAVTTAWLEIRQRIAAYQAAASISWNKAYERYAETLVEKKRSGEKELDWRKEFAAWSQIANEEMVSNQRSEAFLSAQRELLRSALELRSRQESVAGSLGKLFGVPTRQDFDELTRQLTELRRELRAQSRLQQEAVAELREDANRVALPADTTKSAAAAAAENPPTALRRRKP